MKKESAPPLYSFSDALQFDGLCFYAYAYFMKFYYELMKRHSQPTIFKYLKTCDIIMKYPDAIQSPGRPGNFSFNPCTQNENLLGHRPKLYTIIHANKNMIFTSFKMPSPPRSLDRVGLRRLLVSRDLVFAQYIIKSSVTAGPLRRPPRTRRLPATHLAHRVAAVGALSESITARTSISTPRAGPSTRAQRPGQPRPFPLALPNILRSRRVRSLIPSPVRHLRGPSQQPGTFPNTLLRTDRSYIMAHYVRILPDKPP